MPDHSLYGKQKICYTEVTDFTDFQGIGRDPMYKRFDSVYSVINNTIPEQYRDFLAHPLYSAEDDQIQWYVKDWVNIPVRYTQLNGDELAKYKTIKDQTIKAYTDTIASLKGEDRQILIGAMKYIDDDFIFCYDDKVVVVAWGMKPDSNQHIVKGTVIHDLKIQNKGLGRRRELHRVQLLHRTPHAVRQPVQRLQCLRQRVRLAPLPDLLRFPRREIQRTPPLEADAQALRRELPQQ